MPLNEKLAARVRELLADQPKLEEKRMFGGLCFMVNDKMLMGVTEELMCRVGPEAYEAALEQPGVREMDFTGRPMKGYIFVDETGTKNRKDLQHWVDLCLAFNAKARSSKKKK